MLINEYEEGVKSWIQKELDFIKTVEWYPSIYCAFPSPAVFLFIEGWEPVSAQPGDGTKRFTLHIEAVCVVDRNINDSERVARDVALVVSEAIDGTNFDLPCGVAKFVGASPEAMRPELDAFVCWSVAYVHTISVGNGKVLADEIRSGIRVAANPVDVDDPSEYGEV